MKNIAIVTRSMSSGGAERVISEFANYLAAKKIKCTIIMMDKHNVFYPLDERINCLCIGEICGNKILNRIKKYKKLREVIKEINPDIVLSMPEEIGIYVVPAMLGTGIPVVVSERNNPWLMPYSKVTRTLRKIFYPFATGFIFQTKMAASFFSPRIQKKGAVLPNPLDVKKIPERYTGKRRKEIVSTGRFEKQKNFRLLIEAFSEFYKENKDYTLVIYGDGNLREELCQYARTILPEDAVSMPGREKDWIDKSKDSMMFVLSSDFEGMPNALIEAMAAGIPSISTDCPSGGSRDLIINEENGILVPVGDKEKMVAAIKKIAADKEFADSISIEGAKIKELLDAEKICGKWLNYLEGLSK